MAKVTPKENFMKLAEGGQPYYVPFYSLLGASYKEPTPVASAMVTFFEENRRADGGTDMWGVPYAKASEGVDSAMPDTRVTILEDIADWSKVVKFPKAMDVDVEMEYQKTLERIDRTQSAIKIGPCLGPFQQLVGLMGFEGGLMALAEDPDEVSAMLNAMCDLIMPYYKKVFEVFKPDFWQMTDDTCSKMAPFFSPATYKEVFLPIYKRLAEPAMENGVPVIFHNCGNTTPFLDMMYEFGVRVTEPFQEMNDIVACKEKFKGKMSFCGQYSWGIHIPKNWPNFDEEELRQGVRDTIDRCAPGGQYAFAGFPISVRGDEASVNRALQIMLEEVYYYGRKVYGYTE